VSILRQRQWLNYSEVGGGSTLVKITVLHQNHIRTKTRYARTLMTYCEPVCQITPIFLAVQERQFEVVKRQLYVEMTERRSGPFRLNLTTGQRYRVLFRTERLYEARVTAPSSVTAPVVELMANRLP